MAICNMNTGEKLTPKQFAQWYLFHLIEKTMEAYLHANRMRKIEDPNEDIMNYINDEFSIEFSEMTDNQKSLVAKQMIAQVERLKKALRQ